MVFVCTLNPENLDYEVFKRGVAYSVLFRIGFDETKKCNYFAQIGLESMAGPDLEYYFNIVEVVSNNRGERIYWSGNNTSRFILKDDRLRVLNAIYQATIGLLDHAKPLSVYRCTYDENPPDRSLEKHYCISKAFEEAGYGVVMGDPYGSKRWWWAYRLKCAAAATECVLNDSAN